MEPGVRTERLIQRKAQRPLFHYAAHTKEAAFGSISKMVHPE